MQYENSSELFKCVVLEVRPRLQSVNVYLILNIVPKEVVVELKSDCIEVTCDQTVGKIFCKKYKIVPESLNLLVFKNNYVTFRFCTNSLKEELGSFKSEILKNDLQSEPPLDQILQKHFKYDIKCAKCSTAFCTQIQFNKILPLPSGNLELSDFFCHANLEINLDPKESDLFYSKSYFNINLSVVRDKVTIGEDKSVSCKNCLFEVGSVKNNSCKLWFHTVILVFNDSEIKRTPLENCLAAVKNCFDDSGVRSSRIMLSCNSRHICLWIIEKQLKLFIMEDGKDREEQVCKVLFKYFDGKDDEVMKWKEDKMVYHLDVSDSMINDLKEYLLSLRRFIPEEFSGSSGFYISYLDLNFK